MRKWLIILFVLLLSVTAYELSVSFALFESAKSFVVNSDIGKWEISVNDSMINESNTFTISNVKVSSDSNVREDYFAPGTSGYFDIVIDPNDTDVSIYYEIVCRTDFIINRQISLTRIENVGKPDLTNIAPYTYAGIIPLADIKNGVTTTIRFYVTWTNNDNNNETDSLYGSSSADFEIPMEITFRQYLGEGISILPSPTASIEPSPTASVEPDPGE